MNKAITEGLALMPPPFSAGLNLWSQEDGLPGHPTWASSTYAAYVPADQDFGGCMEVQKVNATTKIRCFQNIPYQPGMYLRVTARVKAVAGNLCSVRIAGWAGTGPGTPVPGIVTEGPAVALQSYGAVVEVSAIIGSGNRPGVTMAWGRTPVFCHFGLDLTGANGGIVRIDDITVEDVTDVFHRTMMDWVDVRDYGAIGNGITDDAAAFAAADAAAQGRTLLVSGGTYYIGSNLTISNPVRFEGRVVMPASARLACTRNYDQETYGAAFGDEAEGFRRGLQALFFFTDHVTYDLRGRRIDLAAPIDVAALAGMTSFAQRRVIRNGQINAVAGSAWDTVTVTSVGTYSTSQPDRLTGVANVAIIPVGARVSGTGVGREVYVTAKNIGSGTVTLSQPLWAAAGTRTFTFERYRYMLDFSGFQSLAKFEIEGIELQGNGVASTILLPTVGETFRLSGCVLNKPKDRGITSIGSGCQGIMIDGCQFLSNEQPLAAQDRTTIAINVNANDAKIRGNRIVRFAHFAVMAGSGHMFIGNHFFQGDDETAGVRRAGVVFTDTNIKTLMTGNYVDNCFIELSNERDAAPEFQNEYSFGGLTITGNIFTVNDAAPWFRWLVITPRGPGHYIQGLSVTSNVFRTVNCTVDRVDNTDETWAALDRTRFRNILFEANSFNGVAQVTMSPLVLEHAQNTVADTWVLDGSAYMPFAGRARCVPSVMPDGAIRDGANAVQYALPYAETEKGTGGTQAYLRWPSAVKGKVRATIRCDNPS